MSIRFITHCNEFHSISGFWLAWKERKSISEYTIQLQQQQKQTENKQLVKLVSWLWLWLEELCGIDTVNHPANQPLDGLEVKPTISYLGGMPSLSTRNSYKRVYNTRSIGRSSIPSHYNFNPSSSNTSKAEGTIQSSNIKQHKKAQTSFFGCFSA